MFPSPQVSLLVIANHTGSCPELGAQVHECLGAAGGRVVVVAPALNSRLRHWTSDTDGALAEAADRVATAVRLLRAAGVDAGGQVGDADPMVAVHDAMREHDPAAVLISTWPAGHSHWLERDLVGRARDQLDVPVHHAVSDFGVRGRPAAVGVAA